eukprot:6191242-Pleurochrysis_carterae.AAC.3
MARVACDERALHAWVEGVLAEDERALKLGSAWAPPTQWCGTGASLGGKSGLNAALTLEADVLRAVARVVCERPGDGATLTALPARLRVARLLKVHGKELRNCFEAAYVARELRSPTKAELKDMHFDELAEKDAEHALTRAQGPQRLSRRARRHRHNGAKGHLQRDEGKANGQA